MHTQLFYQIHSVSKRPSTSPTHRLIRPALGRKKPKPNISINSGVWDTHTRRITVSTYVGGCKWHRLEQFHPSCCRKAFTRDAVGSFSRRRAVSVTCVGNDFVGRESELCQRLLFAIVRLDVFRLGDSPLCLSLFLTCTGSRRIGRASLQRV